MWFAAITGGGGSVGLSISDTTPAASRRTTTSTPGTPPRSTPGAGSMAHRPITPFGTCSATPTHLPATRPAAALTAAGVAVDGRKSSCGPPGRRSDSSGRSRRAPLLSSHGIWADTVGAAWQRLSVSPPRSVRLLLFGNQDQTRNPWGQRVEHTGYTRCFKHEGYAGTPTVHQIINDVLWCARQACVGLPKAARFLGGQGHEPAL